MDKITISSSSILSEVLEITEKTTDRPTVCVACGKHPEFSRKFCKICVNGGPFYPVPQDGDFLIADSEFITDELAEEIGTRLIAAFPEDLTEVQRARIAYLWKRKGGSKNGHDVLGRLRKVSGELKFYSGQDYIVVLSADNCQYLNLYQITALIFHELLHASRDDKGRYGTVGHDFEGFRREVEVFGFWKTDIAAMKDAFDKGSLLPLFDTSKEIEAL